MDLLAMAGKGVFADEAFMTQFTYDWSCHESLAWPFAERGMRDAWYHGILRWRLCRSAGGMQW